MYNDYVKKISDQLITHIKQGTAPWQKPWKAGEHNFPYNPKTGNPYKGMNTVILAMQNYSDPRWLTFKQAAELGASVKKGEKSTEIMYWKTGESVIERDKDGKSILDENGNVVKKAYKYDRPRAFTARVFNAEQIIGLPNLEPRISQPEPIRHAKAEAVLKASGANIISLNSNQAYYDVNKDQIRLPEPQQFDTMDNYYSTALHELGHWTGHESRLNRDLNNPYGSEAYAKEELRAEIASMMLGQEIDLGHDPSRHTSYIASWIKILENDPKEIFRAAKDAENIKNFILEFENEKTINNNQSDSLTNMPYSDRKIKNNTDEKLFITVPYEERHIAKAAGAKWDNENKSWYVKSNTNLIETGLSRYSIENSASKLNATVDEQFKEALKYYGLNEENLIVDGQLHRCKVLGDKGGEKSGAYILYENPAGGFIQNFKTGEKINWKPNNINTSLSEKEKETLNQIMMARSYEREQKIVIYQAIAKITASDIFQECDRITSENENAYCKIKGITNTDNIRQIPSSFSKELKAIEMFVGKDLNEVKSIRKKFPNGQVFLKGDLVVPCYGIDGSINTLQLINPSFKSFLKNGKKSGTFIVVNGDKPNYFENKDTIIIAEGYATANAVAQLTNKPVVAAFDAGNLKEVAEEFRKKFISSSIIIAADNDHATKDKHGKNIGLSYAKEAAKLVGGSVLYPDFSDDEKNCSDWDDFKRTRGDALAKKEIQNKLKIAETEALINFDQLITLGNTRDQNAIDDPTTDTDNEYVNKERSIAQNIRDTAYKIKTSLSKKMLSSPFKEKVLTDISLNRDNLSQTKEQRLSQNPTAENFRTKEKNKRKNEGTEL